MQRERERGEREGEGERKRDHARLKIGVPQHDGRWTDFDKM
jgi:hypothetical protein